MQFHKSPISSGLQDVSQILASSRRAQWGPTIRIRLKNSDFWVKRGNAAVALLLIHNIRLGAALRVGIMPRLAFPNMRIQIHPHLISSPNRGKNSAGSFISVGFLCGKLHHLFIFWPLNAAANAKSFSIFERNYKFPFYLMSCKPWFGKISVENESRII